MPDEGFADNVGDAVLMHRGQMETPDDAAVPL
jgi:hypothetical protein